MGGDGWTRTEHLLAIIADRLAVANYQRGGGKGQRPKPISPLARPKRTTYGKTTRSPDEVKAMLARYGPQGAGVG